MALGILPINIIPIVTESRPSESTKFFIQHLHEFHEFVRRKIIVSNDHDKGYVDKHRKEQNFEGEGDGLHTS